MASIEETYLSIFLFLSFLLCFFFFQNFSTDGFIYKEKAKFLATTPSQNEGLWKRWSGSRLMLHPHPHPVPKLLPIICSAWFYPECPGGWDPQSLWNIKERHLSSPLLSEDLRRLAFCLAMPESGMTTGRLWSTQEENLGYSQLNYGLKNAGN